MERCRIRMCGFRPEPGRRRRRAFRHLASGYGRKGPFLPIDWTLLEIGLADEPPPNGLEGGGRAPFRGVRRRLCREARQGCLSSFGPMNGCMGVREFKAISALKACAQQKNYNTIHFLSAQRKNTAVSGAVARARRPHNLQCLYRLAQPAA